VQFHPITAQALSNAFSRLGTLYGDTKTWTSLQANAMAHPVDWGASAAEYHEIYMSLLKVPA
jgi:starch synthase